MLHCPAALYTLLELLIAPVMNSCHASTTVHEMSSQAAEAIGCMQFTVGVIIPILESGCPISLESAVNAGGVRRLLNHIDAAASAIADAATGIDRATHALSMVSAPHVCLSLLKPLATTQQTQLFGRVVCPQLSEQQTYKVRHMCSAKIGVVHLYRRPHCMSSAEVQLVKFLCDAFVSDH